MLVEVAGGVGVPGVELGGDGQVGEPVGLDGLIEGLGLVSGDHVAVGGDLEQLLLALLVGALLGHLAGQLGVTLAQDDDSVAADAHGVELVALVNSLGVVHVVQIVQRLLDVLLVIQIALFIDLHGADGVAGAALLHKLGEDAGGIGRLPLVGHAVQNLLAHGALLPVGDDLLLLNLQVLLGDREVNHLAVVHVVHVFQRVAAQLREAGRGLGIVALLADDQLAVADVECFVGKDVLQGQGAQLRDGYLALVHLIGLCLQDSALHVNAGLGLHAQLSELLNTIVHTKISHFDYPPTLILENPFCLKVSMTWVNHSSPGAAMLSPS